jgi:hypothetical protein
MSLSKLQGDVHNALRSWHNTTQDSSPLDYLQLVRQARLNGIHSARRATNEILLDALETLAGEHEDSANLLRKHFLDEMLMYAIANRMNIGQSTAYRRQQDALRRLAQIIQDKEDQAREAYQSALEKRYKLPSETSLFGVEAQLATLLGRLVSRETPWLASIEGLGGMGKTALANAVIRRAEILSRFHDVAWVSAKQRDFFPGVISPKSASAALSVDTLIDSLLAQFGHSVSPNQSSQEKREALLRLLKQDSYLIVIDNLETVADYQALLPFLWEIINPSKVLITSRYSLREYPGIFCMILNELNQTDSFLLIRNEANTRGLSTLAKASDDQLAGIHEMVGGNPLAIQLVIGQSAFLPLKQVLTNLKEARGKGIVDLYTYIYWQAWQLMDDISRQTLLIMPLTQEGTLEQIQTLSRLEFDDLLQALQQLITLSLVQVGGDLNENRYSIHRLTETFLINEAITWQSSA